MREYKLFNSKLEKANFQTWFERLQVGDNVTIVIMKGFMCANKKLKPINVLQVAAITPAGNIKLSDGTIWNNSGMPLKKIRGLLNLTNARDIQVSNRFDELLVMEGLSMEAFINLGEEILHG